MIKNYIFSQKTNYKKIKKPTLSKLTFLIVFYFLIGSILVFPPMYGCNAFGILIEPSSL